MPGDNVKTVVTLTRRSRWTKSRDPRRWPHRRRGRRRQDLQASSMGAGSNTGPAHLVEQVFQSGRKPGYTKRPHAVPVVKQGGLQRNEAQDVLRLRGQGRLSFRRIGRISTVDGEAKGFQVCGPVAARPFFRSFNDAILAVDPKPDRRGGQAGSAVDWQRSSDSRTRQWRTRRFGIRLKGIRSSFDRSSASERSSRRRSAQGPAAPRPDSAADQDRALHHPGFPARRQGRARPVRDACTSAVLTSSIG